MIAEPALYDAYEAFLAAKAAGESDHAALLLAIEAADKRRAQAVIEALAKRTKAA
jgi:hypothetical protein